MELLEQQELHLAEVGFVAIDGGNFLGHGWRLLAE
jgi:hypothetical protein